MTKLFNLSMRVCKSENNYNLSSVGRGCNGSRVGGGGWGGSASNTDKISIAYNRKSIRSSYSSAGGSRLSVGNYFKCISPALSYFDHAQPFSRIIESINHDVIGWSLN